SLSAILPPLTASPHQGRTGRRRGVAGAVHQFLWTFLRLPVFLLPGDQSSASFEEPAVKLTRRRFLHTALAAGAGLTLAAPAANAIEPIKRPGPAHLRLSLAGYGCRKYLTPDPKTKAKPEWTYDDFIDFAAGLNVDAVELTQYYFPETSPDYL